MVFLFSDGLLAQTLKTACVRSAHILLVEFKFHMGYGLLYKLGYKQHTRTDSEIAFRRHFRIKCGRFTTSFLAAREQIVQPFGDGRVGEDLVFDVGGGDAVIDRHFEQVDDLVRFGAEQGYTENFAAVRVHHGFEQAVGLVEDFGFRNRVGFQFQHFHLAPRLLRGGFG